MEEKYDSQTGLSSKVISEAKDQDARPRILLKGRKRRTGDAARRGGA